MTVRTPWLLRLARLAPFVPLVSAAALVATEAPARADEVPPGGTRYVVKAGDSCASITKHFYGDTSWVDLLHEANAIGGPQPHALAPGRVLVVPPRPAGRGGAPEAKLTSVRNRVDVETPATRPGKVDDPLYTGHRVATAASSSAGLAFRDETQLHLGERSLLVVLGDSRAKTRRSGAAETTLVNGSLRALLGKGAAPVDVATPGGAVAHLGAGAATQVKVDASRTTRLEVHGGGASLDAAAKRVEVAAGFGSKAAPAKPPEPPRPLPAPPVFVRAPSGLLLAGANGLATLEATYAEGPADGPGGAKLPPATAFRVQIARDERFDALEVDTLVPARVTELRAERLVPGAYFVRVAAVDADDFEGIASAPARVVVARVARAAAPPKATAGKEPSSRAALEITPAELVACDAAVVDRAHATTVACRTKDEAAASATATFAPDLPRPLELRARLEADGVVAFAVRDPEDAHYAPSEVRLFASDGVRVEPERVDPRRGVAQVAVPPHVRAFVLTARAEGTAIARADVAVPEAPRGRERLRFEGWLGLGVASAGRAPVTLAPRVVTGAGLRVPAGDFALVGGLELGFSHTAADRVDDARLPDGSRAVDGAKHTLVGLGAPFAIRWERPGARLAPYLVVTPELAHQWARATLPDTGAPVDGASWLFQGTFGGGLLVRLGPGAVGVEAGYRAGRVLASDGGSLRTTGVVATAGYRFFF